MSTTTANPSDNSGGGTVTFPRVLKSEWIKFWSLRSSYWTLLTAIILMVGLGALFCFGTAASWDSADYPAEEKLLFDPTGTALGGGVMAQLAVAVLGVLVITGEYSTGMIHATIAAVPKRVPVLVAKAIVYAVVAFLVMTISSFAVFFIGQAILSTENIGTSLSEPGVLRAVFGTGLYFGLVGVLGLCLGALLRNTAGTIAVLFGVLLVLPIIALLIPDSWGGETIQRYLPSNAGSAITMTVQRSESLAPWTGFGIFVLYILVILAAACVVVRRRDA